MVCILFNDVPHIFIKFCILYMYLLSDASGVNISTSLPTAPSVRLVRRPSPIRGNGLQDGARQL